MNISLFKEMNKFKRKLVHVAIASRGIHVNMHKCSISNAPCKKISDNGQGM